MTHPAPLTKPEFKLPHHVAVIMDGNGRWARARGLPRTAGHKKGADAVKRIVEAAGQMGVSYLTLYSFSSENWKRPAHEIKDLMGLLRFHLRSEVARMHENNMRLLVVGDRKGLESDIVDLIESSEARTSGNTGLTLVLALNYGGRGDIVATARKLAKAVAAGDLDPTAIDQELFARNLSTCDIPPPDLLIRTGGEQRVSNFLLWEMAYTEFVFLDIYWPDFSAEHLEKAIREFHGRERRFGDVGA